MVTNHTQRAFETAIEDSLLTRGGYSKADPKNFDKARDPSALLRARFFSSQDEGFKPV